MTTLIKPSVIDQLQKKRAHAIVFLFKPRCPYCVQFMPTFEALAKKHGAKRLKDASAERPIFLRMDMGRYMEYVNRMFPGVARKTVPAFLFIRPGAEPALHMGESIRVDLMGSYLGATTKKKIIRDLDEISDTDALCLVYADWCPACKSFLPKYDRMDRMPCEKYYMKAEDADESLGIQFIPTVLVIKGGKAPYKFEGKLTAEALRNEFNR